MTPEPGQAAVGMQIAFELMLNLRVVPDAMQHAMLLRRSGTVGRSRGHTF